MQHCFLVSEIARFLGSAMGIAIANRKNRCDFGALRARCSEVPVLVRHHRPDFRQLPSKMANLYREARMTFHPILCVRDLLQLSGRDISSPRLHGRYRLFEMNRETFQQELVFEISIRCGHTLQRQQSTPTTRTSPLAWIPPTFARTRRAPKML